MQRSWTEAEEPPRVTPSPTERASRAQADLPFVIGAGVRLVILLLLFGAGPAALAVAVATAVGWALWHHWPHLSEEGGLSLSPADGSDTTTRGPAR
jgi:hypothetical protein